MGCKKLQYWVLLFLIGTTILFNLCGCKVGEKSIFKEGELKDNSLNGTPYNLSITALDLTEDAPYISTQNDELLVVVYSITNQGINLCFENYMTFQKTPESKSFGITLKSNLDSLCFVVLEMDSENGLKQTEPVLRINLNTLEKAFEQGNNVKIKEYLGDDDLISIQKFSKMEILSKQLTFSIKGSHLLDSYSYNINLSPTIQK